MDKMSNSELQDVLSIKTTHKDDNLLFGLWKDRNESVEDVVRNIK